jgi:protein TonB
MPLLVAALLVHGTVAVILPVRAAHRPDDVASERVTEIVDVELPPPAAAPTPPATPAVEPAVTAPPVGHLGTRRQAARVPAVPAQAAEVLTSKPDPNEPVDLSGTFVIGSALKYTGGTTSAGGTNSSATYGLGSWGDAGEREGARPSVAPDRSRRPTMTGSSLWNCPFPQEADQDHVDRATVGVQVTIDADGVPKSVSVVRDPGHGFAREAQRCALGKRWEPALDREGSRVESTVPINIHFDR